jgi:hypothetical protein
MAAFFRRKSSGQIHVADRAALAIERRRTKNPEGTVGSTTVVRSRPPPSMNHTSKSLSGPVHLAASIPLEEEQAVVEPILRLQFTKIVNAAASSQSWMTRLKRYASPPADTISKKSPATI